MTRRTSRRPALWRTRLRQRDEGGIVLVYFAICLTVLMGMAAFAVDIGSWQLRAAQLQRAADAASLAGVVYMPGNFATAQAVALNVAQDNGIDPSMVSVSPVPSNPHELLVSIKDPSVPTYFARAFGIDSIHETRDATAEYQGPIPLGSPENSFGTGNTSLGVGSPSNIWAAVNGYCTSKENGDQYLSEYDSIFTGGKYVCPASPAAVPNPGPPYLNNEYSAEGYYYDVLSPVTQPITIQLYDPSYEPKCGTSPDSAIGGSGTTINTIFTLWDSPTPLDHTKDVSLGSVTYGTTDPAAPCATWVAPFTFTAQAGEEYRLQVATQAGQANSNGSNSYGLRLAANGSFARCSTVKTVAWYSAACPVIHGEQALSVNVNQPSATATFYLAQVDPQYAGHTMVINLFDPGEGSHFLQIINPDTGLPATFTYHTIDDTTAQAKGWGDTSPGGCAASGVPNPCTLDYAGGPTTQIDVSGTIKPPPGIVSGSQYDDRLVQLTVPIPSNYVAAKDGWWSIAYTATNSVNDRTTWSVSLLGAPIHLVQ